MAARHRVASPTLDETQPEKRADGGTQPLSRATPTCDPALVSHPTHLRVYRFDPGAVFEGGLVGAVERMQLGRETKLLDALFVTHNPASGGLAAVDLASGGAGGTFASMLDFRLDAGRREAITERTLAEHRGGVPRTLIEAIAATLDAGAAIFAVLHTGGAPTVLDDAVERSHGRLIADDPVDAQALPDAGPQLLAAVGSAAADTSAR
jgi:hypothetical protein